MLRRTCQVNTHEYPAVPDQGIGKWAEHIDALLFERCFSDVERKQRSQRSNSRSFMPMTMVTARTRTVKYGFADRASRKDRECDAIWGQTQHDGMWHRCAWPGG